MFLAINEVRKEKLRFALISMVVILVSYLVFFLLALAYGLATSYTQALDKWDAGGIVLSKNANDNIGRSLLVGADYEQLLDDDVALLGVSTATVDADESDDVALFGIDRESWLVPEVVEGRDAIGIDEVVVSDELAVIGIGVGDVITLQGANDSYSVVGVVEKATFQTAPVIYMDIEQWRVAASEVVGMTAMRDNSTVNAVVTRADAAPDFEGTTMNWQSIRDFSFRLPGYQAQVLTFSLMIGFLISIAALVLAIFVYILTMQKKSIFGVLKAEGVPSSYIAWSVMVQVGLLSIFGLVVGCGLALLSGFLLGSKVPFAVNPLFFAGISAVFLLFAALGGLASVRSVTKIDPVEAIE